MSSKFTCGRSFGGHSSSYLQTSLPPLPPEFVHSLTSSLEPFLEPPLPSLALKPLPLQTGPLMESLSLDILSDSVRRTLHVEQFDRARHIGAFRDVDGTSGTWNATDLGILYRCQFCVCAEASVTQLAFCKHGVFVVLAEVEIVLFVAKGAARLRDIRVWIGNIEVAKRRGWGRSRRLQEVGIFGGGAWS